MHRSARPWVILLCCTAVSGAVLAAYGAITGTEPLLALGLPVAFLSLILLPVLRKRARLQEKVERGEGLLASWEYSPAEAAQLAARRRGEVLRAGWKLALLLTVCGALILLPIAGAVANEFGAVPQALWLGGAVTAVLIWAAVPLAAAYQAGEVNSLPCRTRICGNCLVIANRWLPLNDYHRFKLERAALVASDSGLVVLRIDCSYQAGKRLSTFRKTVEVPVPAGMEEDARRVAAALR